MPTPTPTERLLRDRATADPTWAGVLRVYLDGLARWPEPFVNHP